MQYLEFVRRMKEIKAKGYVPTHRRGDTGIGKTLEDLLGIRENNIAGPDFGIYELKSGRKGSSSMLTLFTLAPRPRAANAQLLRAFGYPQRKAPAAHIEMKQLTLTGSPAAEQRTAVPLEDKELHVTIDSIKPNSVGLKLLIRTDRIEIGNDAGVEAYWDLDSLGKAFERKQGKSAVYVLADSRSEKGVEHFWYNEAYRLSRFGFARFSKLVHDGKLKADLRLGHYPDGRPHDHGTGFRILPKHLPECFEVVERIL